MATVTYDSQSLLVNGRRVWMVGAQLEYALTPRAEWRAALSALRMSGFNTVRTSAPWNLHEPRASRRSFTDHLDIGAFLKDVRAAGLHAVVRVGPVVGDPFADGGLPAWCAENSSGRVREADEAFMSAVSGWFQELLSHVVPQQLAGSHTEANSGAVIALELEQHWHSDGQQAGGEYFRQLVRLVRERGALVPLFTNNGLWIAPDGTIELWEGSSQLLAHSRQLRRAQPGAPAIVVVRGAAEAKGAGEGRRTPDANSAQNSARAAALACAGGAQTVVADAPTSGALRPLLHFCSSFGSVLAQAQPDMQSVSTDPERAGKNAITVVPLQAGAASVAWVFPTRNARSTTLLTADGRAVTVDAGSADGARGGAGGAGDAGGSGGPGSVDFLWLLFDADLQGIGRWEWGTLTPLAVIGRRMVVVCGCAGQRGQCCIDGAVLDCEVPGAKDRPLVVTHHRVVVAVLNWQQARTMLVQGQTLIIGAAQVLPDGSVTLASGHKSAVKIASSGAVQAADVARRGRGTEIATEVAAPVTAASSVGSTDSAEEFQQGAHPHFAPLKQHQSLAACGAAGGAGWFRITLRAASAGARTVAFPNAGGGIQWWLAGRPVKPHNGRVLKLRLKSGDNHLVALVQHASGSTASSAAGSAASSAAGFGATPVVVDGPKRVKGAAAAPSGVDPFALRGHLRGVTRATLARTPAVEWVLPTSAGWLLDLAAVPVRGVVSLGARAIALVDPADPGSTLVAPEVPGAAAATGAAAADKRLTVRFTPLDGADPKMLRVIMAKTRWFTLRSKQPSVSWAFARAATPRSGATPS